MSVPIEGRDGLEQSQEIMLLVVQHPDESVKAVLDLRERDRQCVNTLGGSDTTCPSPLGSSGGEFELDTPPDHY